MAAAFESANIVATVSLRWGYRGPWSGVVGLHACHVSDVTVVFVEHMVDSGDVDSGT